MQKQFLPQNLSAVRATILRWTQHNRCSLAALATRARLNRSVVHRLMHGGQLDLTTAVRLYEAIYRDLDLSERQQFVHNLGLLDTAQVLATATRQVAVQLPDASSKARFTPGIVRFDAAVATAQADAIAAVPIFQEAEALLSFHPDLAIAVAGERIQLLINMGEYDLAQSEILRVTSFAAAPLSDANATRFASLRAWLYFDVNDFDESHYWFDRLLTSGRQTGDLMIQSEATHFLALLDLARARCAIGQKQRIALARQAAHAFDLHRAVASQLPESRIDDGFACHRMAEFAQAEGDGRRATQLRKQARVLLAGETALAHVDTSEAAALLYAGEADQARRLAERALDIAIHISYRLGMARALYQLSIAAQKSGDLESAIDCALTILHLVPAFADETGYRIADYVRDLLSDARRASDMKDYCRFEQQLQERMCARQGHYRLMTQFRAIRLGAPVTVGMGITIM